MAMKTMMLLENTFIAFGLTIFAGLSTGIGSALAIGIHNFPEGLATFTSALKDPALGAWMAISLLFFL